MALLALSPLAYSLTIVKGETRGKAEVQAKFDLYIANQATAVSNAKASAADSMLTAVTALSAALQDRDKKFDATLTGVKNEISKNRVYTDCHVTDDGVRIYNATGTASDAGTPTSN